MTRGATTHARSTGRTHRGGLYDRGSTRSGAHGGRAATAPRGATAGTHARRGGDSGFRHPYSSRGRSDSRLRSGGTTGGLHRPTARGAISSHGFARSSATRHGGGHYNRHSYYNNGHVPISFHYNRGPYDGWRYYSPYRHWSGAHFGFFYAAPVSWAYVPFGFYSDSAPVYTTNYIYLREEPAEEYVYEVTESDEEPVALVESADEPVEPAEPAAEVEPEPAAGTPVAERYLREASVSFRESDYFEAATKFRLAALAVPENAGPLFALGQALVGMGSDIYAARVIRKALLMNPDLVKEPADLVGVYASREEFDKVFTALRERAGHTKADSDAHFLLGVQLYFSGDPRATNALQELADELPEDRVVELLNEAAIQRYVKAADELPPVEPK